MIDDKILKLLNRFSCVCDLIFVDIFLFFFFVLQLLLYCRVNQVCDFNMYICSDFRINLYYRFVELFNMRDFQFVVICIKNFMLNKLMLIDIKGLIINKN